MTDTHRRAPAEQIDHEMSATGGQADMRLQPQRDLAEYRPASKLAGTTALVTIGDSGIGRAVALAFALQGAQVAITYHGSDADASGTARMIEARGRRCFTPNGDVSRKADCERSVATAVGAFGRLDALVDNAAFLGGSERLADVSEALRQTFEIIVSGYVYMGQTALPHLVRVGGTMINTSSNPSSTTSILGKDMTIPYSSSKGAINMLTPSMALELADRGVRVNAVVPGPFWTSPIAQQAEEATTRFGDSTILTRATPLEEIAPAYVYLATPNSRFVTGTLMGASGGFRWVD